MHREALIYISVLIATEFSLEELEGATESFKTVIGEGAFGTVFLGHNIRNSATSVAVKVLNEVGELIVISSQKWLRHSV